MLKLPGLLFWQCFIACQPTHLCVTTLRLHLPIRNSALTLGWLMTVLKNDFRTFFVLPHYKKTSCFNDRTTSLFACLHTYRVVASTNWSLSIFQNQQRNAVYMEVQKIWCSFCAVGCFSCCKGWAKEKQRWAIQSLRDSLICQEQRCRGDCPQGDINHNEGNKGHDSETKVWATPSYYSAMVIVLLTLWHPLTPTSSQGWQARSCSHCAVPACLRA